MDGTNGPEEGLMAAALGCGADGAAMIDVAGIVFSPGFRAFCEDNRCGNYNRNWRCPPKAGEIGDLIGALRARSRAMVFNLVVRLAGPFDWKGMEGGGLAFARVCQDLAARAGGIAPGATVLGAGPCRVCPVCALVTDEPCRNPDLAVTSLEACGVDVGRLSKLSGLSYHAGPSTVTYFGAVFV
ncbi:MAG: DUF2284 domain-containing protein [Deltaproteobacteria bacterium]|jgi:predicted metal-binding protein|nr:DUF2284 domain-containing protein [Deltaproteobacteria bacterium]